MFIKSSLVAAALIPVALSRMLLIERDGRPFYPRRFGQEQCGGIGGELGGTCAGQICGVLGGRVPGSLLAAADPCAQQDLADDIIDASKSQDATTASKMVAIAVRVRQCEKNTPPDFTKNPPALRNSVFCLKAPRNSQLDGLVQAQDPANDPTLFFDVATKSTVLKGSQANTFPFGQAPANLGGGNSAQAPVVEAVSSPAATSSATPSATIEDSASTGVCAPVSTVTVTATAGANIADVTSCAPAVTVTVTATAGADVADVTTTEAAAAATTTADVAAPTVAASTSSAPGAQATGSVISDFSGALNFGSCTNPAVEFGPAFEGRKLSEFTFEPEDKTEFAQGSALNGQIVLTAICNILNDKCQAPAATVTACKNAVTAVANVTGGEKADKFNAALGIITNFADIPAAPGGGPGSVALATTANFNKCSTPQIAFGIFDGRTEDSFEPVGSDFQHGSALNPSIITTFVCDTLVNKCDANQIAINDCQAAIAATSGLSGQALVDKFNSVVSQHV